MIRDKCICQTSVSVRKTMCVSCLTIFSSRAGAVMAARYAFKTKGTESLATQTQNASLGVRCQEIRVLAATSDDAGPEDA